MSKIIDILHSNLQDDKNTLFSFEYFPPKTPKGIENLYERIERMSYLEPCWIDITCGAGGSTNQLTHQISSVTQNQMGISTMMHLTCSNQTVDEISMALKKAKDSGIRNILAIRGDPPKGEQWKKKEGGFEHAIDLVHYIKREYGDWFCICVAGYPESHPEAPSYEADLIYLKEKVNAGADMIITQFFYDTDIFLKFVVDCRKLGISVPIIPGIMPIHTFNNFRRMTMVCGTKIPPSVAQSLEPIKNDDEAVKEYGVKLGIQMCKTLIDSGVKYLHFYTLNLEKSVTQILEGLQIVQGEKRKPVPWRYAPRTKEEVRPVFWSQRPISYIQRTSAWDEFPNGRWGDSRSPAFGELTDYHVTSLHQATAPEYLNINPNSEQEVFNIFSSYCRGEIPSLPWCDQPLALESMIIKEKLVSTNKNGFLTINSQPRINAASSTDEAVGWGPVGGYIYQKAYIEFFASPDNVRTLIEVAKKFPNLTFHAVNRKGESYSNTNPGVNAITWGVFPGREIQQPTVVDSTSFLVWKDEAFALWDRWANSYPDGSISKSTLTTMISTYFLVNIVDNDYVSDNSDIFAIFQAIIRRKESQNNH